MCKISEQICNIWSCKPTGDTSGQTFLMPTKCGEWRLANYFLGVLSIFESGYIMATRETVSFCFPSGNIEGRSRGNKTPGGYSIYPSVGRCGTAPHTLTLFKTNIADFPTLFKTEFRFFNTLFKTFNTNIN